MSSEKSTKKNLKNMLTVVCMVVLLYGMLLPQGTAFAAEKPETVKVGFYQFDGYHDISKDGIKSGYGYDFLQMISGYAKFDYKYIGYDKSWDDMFKMLDDGEIDMLTSAQYTKERAAKYDYCETPIGYSEAVLTTSLKEKKLTSGDYSSYENMRVGMMKGSSQNEKMFDFAKSHGFTFSAVYYDTQEELEKALQSGKNVDTIVTTSIRTLGKERVLERFGRAPFYIIVKKGNTALMDKIDYALTSLNRDYPGWISILYQKYYSINDSYQALDPNKEQYLSKLEKSGKELTVLINPDMDPYSYFKDHHAKGILVDYFDKICKQYDLKVRYLEVDSSATYLQAIYDKKADIVLSTNYLCYEADRDGYYLTKPFLNASLCLVTSNKRDENMKMDEMDGKIAIVSGMSSVEQMGSKRFPKATLVSYDTAEDCINAVKSEKADGALLYEYAAYRFYNSDWKNELQIMVVSDQSVTFSIAVPKEKNTLLYGVMCQGVESVSSTELQAIVSPYVLTSNAKSEPFWIYIYHRPILFVTLLVLLFALIVAVTVWKLRKRAEALRSKQLQAEYEATHDSLTGLYNRKGYQNIVSLLQEDKRPYAYLQIDVDNFKKFNDTYGHALGDEVLIQVAKQLREAFRTDDYVFRFGGDEFAVLLSNCDENAWKSISNKQQIMHVRLNQIMKKNMSVTLSMGISHSKSGVFEKMASMADLALYRVKKNGRAGCCVLDEEEHAVYEWKDDINGSVEISPLVRSDTGACHIELPNDPSKKRRLVCDETARMLMGFSQTMTPEECYEDWFTRIDAPSKAVISSTYHAMAEKEQAECTYLYLHPIKGWIVVRSGGRAERKEDGIYLYGYHQSLENTQMVFNEDDSRELIGALAHLYCASYYINLQKDTYRFFNTRTEIDHHLEAECASAAAFVNRYVKAEVCEAQCEAMYRYADLHTLASRLQNKRFVEKEYVSKEEALYRMRFVKVRSNEMGLASHVLMLVAPLG